MDALGSGSGVLAHVPRARFWRLPSEHRSDGQERRTGIEIEFAGLSEQEAADIVRALWGGRADWRHAHALTLRATAIGDVEVVLDTSLTRHGGTALTDAALDWSRVVVPVEIVLPPLAPGALEQADRLVRALRRAGAAGSREALAYGFGVHLNVELAAESAGAVIPLVRAYALIEDWLRGSDPLDPTRRLLPFVDPYPRGFVDLLAQQAAGWRIDDLLREYLAHTPTRNRGLDVLPLLEHLRPEAVRAALGGAAKGGRPAWHYRLPEARVDEPGWSIAYEWNRWCIVERVAHDAALLERLARGWVAHRDALITLRRDWAREVEKILQEVRIWLPRGH